VNNNDNCSSDPAIRIAFGHVFDNGLARAGEHPVEI
jgi:hypothetical protein